MALLQQERDMLLASAMQSYIFNFCFETRNPGYTFDPEAWTQALNDLTNNDNLVIMNDKFTAELVKLMNNLDNYKNPKIN